MYASRPGLLLNIKHFQTVCSQMCEYGAVGKYELFRVIRFLNIFNMGKGKKDGVTSQAERAYRSGTCATAPTWVPILKMFGPHCMWEQW